MHILTPLIAIAIAALVMGTLAWVFVWFIEYLEHVTETIRNEMIIYDWATFKQFVKKFEGCIEIYPDITVYDNGVIYFSRYKKYCESSVDLTGAIQFNNAYMILYPWSWIRCKFWLRKYCKHRATRQKGLWRN